MIVVEGLSKSYAKQALFDDVAFKINRRERVGLVGRNGHGKTTLFRMIVGLEEPDAGSITKPRHYRIGYVRQDLGFTERTVFDEGIKALPAGSRAETWRVEKVLVGLGFELADLDKTPGQLSGGYQVRLNLAKVLLADFQMLLLDEPTNYLDITSIRWLERFLNAWPGELMLITHDRAFMDKVVTHTLGIHRRKLRKVTGDTAKYYDQIAQEEEIYEKTRLNDERKQKEMELFITRFRAKARLAGLVQSRVKSLEKMEKKEKLVSLRNLDFAFAEKPFHHKYALEMKDVHFHYDPARPLFRDFNLSIGARDRVFVIGPNGKGKTTLLKLMSGVLEPLAGEIVSPQSVAPAYFEQTNVSSLHPGNTVLEELVAADPEGDPKRSRFIAGAMMFEGDDALKPISVLSGGEKSRVMLGKILSTPVNLLLLDEPTNHLDLESSDALLEAIDQFDGAVVMVTHNEMFLHALAERLVVFDNGSVFIYEGGYPRFLEKVGWREEGGRGTEGVPEAAAPARPKISPAELRKRRAEIIAERSRVLKPLETRIAGLEAALERLDAEIKAMNQGLVDASTARDGAKVVELSKAMHKAQSDMNARFEELEAATRADEEARGRFERRLKELEEPEA